MTGGHATIFANEAIPNITTVQFIDGKTYFVQGQKMDFNDPSSLGDILHPPIETSLFLLSQEIEKEWKAETLVSTYDEEIPSKRKHVKIEPVEYDGSVGHFRAWMDKFLAVNGKTFKGTWEGHRVEYDIGYFTPAGNTTREVWNVYINQNVVINGKSPSDSHFAMNSCN